MLLLSIYLSIYKGVDFPNKILTYKAYVDYPFVYIIKFTLFLN